MRAILDIDIQEFLGAYWQTRPLFLPAALPGFTPPADANELAGLALEEEIDSRIISRCGDRWEQTLGPFEPGDFDRDEPWSLLVQSVDQYWESALELMQSVPFLPSWRRDNLMMSYASDGGSAGPHFDLYDVFIVQGEGQRRWSIGQRCDATTPLLQHAELKLLADFEVREEYTLQCGDVLYIPPGIAHHGVSLGESTSFSIGFRAPRLGDLAARLTDQILESPAASVLLADAQRSPAKRSGEITTADIESARQQALQLFTTTDPTWFGELLTESVDPDDEEPLELPAISGALRRHPTARLAWARHGDGLLVFARGRSRYVAAGLQPLMETLCADHSVAVDRTLRDCENTAALLAWLLSLQAVAVHE